MRGLKTLLLRVALLAFLIPVFLPAGAGAAETPPLPEPLKNLAAEGAQMRYLGQKGGLDGWIAIKGGQEQYFYVTGDGEAFVMGVMFDKSGKVVTVDQVRALQDASGADSLDLFAGDALSSQKEAGPDQIAATKREFKTPSEQLFDDIEHSNWFVLGNPEAPYIYTFIDPQCPHCHDFLESMRRDYIENGLLQVRVIPVGFRDDTRAQAAFLLAVPDPQKRLYSHLDGDAAALPVNPDVNQQGIQRNLAVMQSWKVNGTPFTVYRSGAGEVKIIQGPAQDVAQIVTDLRPGQ